MRSGLLGKSIGGGVFFFALTCIFARAEINWQSPQFGLGSLGGDGTLQKVYPLGQLGGSPEFAFPIELKYRTDVSKNGALSKAKSLWEIPQLITSLAPKGGKQLLWQMPGGGTELFDLALARNKDGAVSLDQDWTAYDLGQGIVEIDSKDHWTYRYQLGQLIGLIAPDNRELAIVASAGRISEIWEVAAADDALLQSANDVAQPNPKNAIAKNPSEDIPLLSVKYNAEGLPVDLTLGYSHQQFFYNGSAQMVQWQNGLGKDGLVDFQYDSEGLLNAIVDQDGVSHPYTWATVRNNGIRAAGSMGLAVPKDQSAILASDETYKYQYGTNSDGVNLIRTDADGKTDKIVFNPRTETLQAVDPDGKKTISVYGTDGDHKLYSVTDNAGQQLIKYAYDRAGHVILKKEFGKPTMGYEYDEQGRLTAITREGHPYLDYSYEADNQKPSFVTDPLGQKSELSYNLVGQLVSVKDAAGAVTKLTYDRLGHLTQTLFPNGTTAITEYDSFGRVTKSQGIDGKVVQLSYGENGKISSAHENGNDWVCKYDGSGQLAGISENGKDKIENEISIKNGVKTVETKTDAGQTTKTYDGDGHLLSETNALGQTTVYRYDGSGHLAGWTDARGGTIDFKRDSIGHLLEQQNGLGQLQSWAYDENGRIKEHVNGVQKIDYSYDSAGHLSDIDYGQGQKINFIHDDLGRVITATAGAVTTDYAYDDLDRVIAVCQQLGDGTVEGLCYQYTPTGQKAAVGIYKQTAGPSPIPAAWNLQSTKDLPKDFPSMGKLVQITQYHYDALGRLVALDVDGQNAVCYEYDSMTQRLARKTFANGTVVQYVSDGDGCPIEQKAINRKTGAVLQDIVSQWDGDGKLVSRTINGTAKTYGYDPLGRLASVAVAGHPELSEIYQYDATGNIVSRQIGSATIQMEYDLANQLARSIYPDGTNTRYVYDKAGRLVEELTPEGKSLAMYTYGYLDKVTQVTEPTEAAGFSYDAAGMLVSKTKQGHTEDWLWDGMALASKGGEEFANELHPQLEGVPVVASGVNPDEDTKYFLNDELGNTLSELQGKEDAIKANPMMSTSFGMGLNGRNVAAGSVDSESVQPANFIANSDDVRFTGKPYDADLGAYVFPCRNYKPELGRWASADPSGFPDGVNGQIYAANPTLQLDSTGLDIQLVNPPTFTNTLTSATRTGAGTETYNYGTDVERGTTPTSNVNEAVELYNSSTNTYSPVWSNSFSNTSPGSNASKTWTDSNTSGPIGSYLWVYDVILSYTEPNGTTATWTKTVFYSFTAYE